MKRSRLTLAAVALLGLSVMTAPPATAVDDPSDGGLWYVDAMRLEAVHQKASGKGITVAVIDTPINPRTPDLRKTDLALSPRNQCNPKDRTTLTTEAAAHGTHMVSLVIGTGAGRSGGRGVHGIAPSARVFAYVGNPGAEGRSCQWGLGVAIRQAVIDGAQIISISQTAGYEPLTVKAIAEAHQAGVVVVAAAPNEGYLAPDDWPAIGNGVVTVEASDRAGRLLPPSVSSPSLDVLAPGGDILAIYPDDTTGRWDHPMLTSGTSNATAVTAGALAVAWSAHPEATGNQMIQALLRTTDTNAQRSEPTRTDRRGYGVLSLPRLVASDPTSYPDTNPLISDDPDAAPSRETIADTPVPSRTAPTTTPTATATPTPTPSADAASAADDAAEASDDSGSPLIVIAGVVVLFAAVAAVIVIVVARRGRTVGRG